MLLNELFSFKIMKLPCVVKKLKTEKTANRKERGLSLLVQQCFGKPLDKTYQISNWERRPLCTEQLNYAGRLPVIGTSCFLLAFLNLTTCHLSNLRSISLI